MTVTGMSAEPLAALLRIVGADTRRWQLVISEITRRATMMTLQGGIDSVRDDLEAGRL
jgi:hypothetical protein